MKRLKLLSAALSVSCGIGVLMAVILTGNKTTLPRTAVVVPTQKPVIVRNNQPVRLPTRQTVQNNIPGVDPIVTSSTGSGIKPETARDIGELLGKKKPAENPYPNSGETITVQSGDTLFAIAKRSGINMQKLAKINTIDAPYVIRPGQILRISDTR